MKADVQYNDFKGSAAADISDYIAVNFASGLKGIGHYFNIDTERFTPIGISIYGTENFSVSLYCVDSERSTPEKEFIVKISIDRDKNLLDILFKRLHIVLHDRHDKKYPTLDYDEEANYEDFHEKDDEE